MTTKKKISYSYFIICCGLLAVTVLLSCPAVVADNSGILTITGSVPLNIYNIAVTDIGQSDATVTWNTNGNADSTVAYGTTTSYGSVSIVGGMTESHTITLTGLSPGTVYHYLVISLNPTAGIRASSTDSTFTTTGLTPVTTVPTANGGGGGTNGRSSGTNPGGILSAIQPGTIPALIASLLAPPQTGTGQTGTGLSGHGNQNPSPGVHGIVSNEFYQIMYLIAVLIFTILSVLGMIFGWVQSLVDMAEAILQTSPLNATALAPDSADIVISYNGGKGAARVRQFTVKITDDAGNSQTHTIGQQQQKTPLKIGISVTVKGSFSGKKHIVGTVKFKDGTERVILDKYI